MTLTGSSAAVAASVLEQCGGSVKHAILVLRTGISPGDAPALLERAQGQLRAAIDLA
jgi:N-acetylmuramic acid 6-phosphate (MurNAc-6-P) etherase